MMKCTIQFHLAEFVKRHKVLTCLFWVGCFLILKASGIPYILHADRLWIVRVIFDQPGTIFWREVFSETKIFAEAIITSLFFYYLVDFVPRLKEERKVHSVIKPKLVSLYMYLDELIKMIDYVAADQKVHSGSFDALCFNNNEYYCNVDVYIDGHFRNTQREGLNLIDDGWICLKNIDSICQQLMGTVTLLNANQSLIDCLASITMNDLMEIWPERLTDYPEDRIVWQINMQEEYNALLSSREELKPFVEKKMEHFYSTVPEKEAKKDREDEVKFLREHPEAQCVLAEASRRRKELLK